MVSPDAYRQYAVDQRVIESLSADLHTEFITNRKVAGGQSSGRKFLIKEDGLSGTMQTAPPHRQGRSESTRARVSLLPVTATDKSASLCRTSSEFSGHFPQGDPDCNAALRNSANRARSLAVISSALRLASPILLF